MYAICLEMTFTISCVTCGGDFRIPESLFATRFAGRETKIKCKKCGGLIVVDGSRNAPVRASGRPSAAPGRARISTPPLPARASTPPSPGRVSTPPLPGRTSRPPARPSTLSGRRSPLGSSGPRRASRPPPAAAARESPTLRPRPAAPVAALPVASVAALPVASNAALPAASVEALPVASLEAPSISSASLRAVEVPQAVSDSEPLAAQVSSSADSPSPAVTAAAPQGLSAPTPAKVATGAPASRRGWVVLGAAAVAALAAVLAQGGPASEVQAPASPATLPEPEDKVATERPSDPPPATPAPPESVVAQAPPAEGPALPVASAAPEPPPSSPAYNEKALEGALHWGISNAEQCHRGGRPSGTAQAILTFGPAGKILRAELQGEPIASAPVSKCILSFLRSMMIPAFAGSEFTITREITLR